MYNSNPYDAILFDFDGVLADTEPLHFECYRDVLQPLGIQLDWTYYLRHGIGVSDQEFLERLAREAHPAVPAAQVWPAAFHAKKGLFRQRSHQRPLIEPPTRRLLRRLHEDGFLLAVVSSSSRVEIEPILEASGIRPYLQVTVFAEDVSRLKPSPDPYRKAVSELSAAKPLAVEDSKTGAESARAAGLDVLILESPCKLCDALTERLGKTF